jgi:hypothetical protein
LSVDQSSKLKWENHLFNVFKDYGGNIQNVTAYYSLKKTHHSVMYCMFPHSF